MGSRQVGADWPVGERTLMCHSHAMGKRSTWGLVAALAMIGSLAACQTTEDLAVVDDAACAQIGITPGSDNYGQCRLVMERKRIAERQERAARMQAFGAAMSSAGQSLAANNDANYSPVSAPTTTCFKRSEAMSGMNKMCFYDCLGSTVAHNISGIGLCPLTIQH